MTTQTVTLRLVADNGQLVGTLKTSQQELQHLGGSAQAAGKEAEQGFNRVGRAARSSSTFIARAQQTALGFASAFVSIRGLLATSRIADGYANITAQLKLASDSQAEYAAAENQVYAIAQRTSTRLQSTADLYARITRSTAEYGIEQGRVLAITETINQTFAVSGTAAANQANAITQLTQAFAGGVLRAEEFNSVIENSPRLAQAIADGLGVGIGELRKQVNNGTVTVDRMIAALEDQATAVRTEFAQMPLTIERGWTRVVNAVDAYIGRADQARGVSAQVGEGLAYVAANFDLFADAALTSLKIGAAYLALFHAAPAVVGLATAAVLAHRDAVLSNRLAQELGIKTAWTWAAAMKGAAGVAFAGFAGWQIGSWLRDNFLEAQLAGIYFVESTLVAWERLKQGAAITWEGVKAAGVGALNTIRERLADLVGGAASAAEFTDVLGIGEGTIAQLRAVEASLRPTTSAAEQFRQAVAEINAETDRSVAGLRAITGAMVNDAYAADAAADAADRLGNATGGLDRPTGLGADALRELKEEAAKLREQLYPADAQVRALTDSIATLAATGGSDQEIARFVDLFAQDLVGGLDEASAAARRYEQQVAVLETLLGGIDVGGETFAISQQQFDELAARAKAAWEAVRDGAPAVDEAGSAFDDFMRADYGAQFAQGFDDASQALGAFVHGMTELVDVQEEYAKARRDAAGDSQKLAQAEAHYQEAQVSLYGDLAASAKGFFNEGSKGYKALQAAEQSFRAFEIAMAAKSLAAKLFTVESSTAETVASVAPMIAAEGAKAAAGAQSTIASAAVGIPFPGNLAAIAATVAALAAVGIAVSGGGGGSASAPRSNASGRYGVTTSRTVLGDASADSHSVANSLEQIQRIELEDLAYSAQMVQALNGIQASLTNVAADLSGAPRGRFEIPAGSISDLLSNGTGTYRSQASLTLDQLPTHGAFGQPLNLLESVHAAEQQIAAGLRPLTGEVQDVIGGIVESAATAFGVLGEDVDDVRARILALDLPDLVLRAGMKPEKIEAALQAYFSSIGDSIVALISTDVLEFQRAGEGALETLTRLATEVSVLGSAADALGIQLNATGPDLLAIADELAGLAGGVDALSDNVAAFVDFALTEAEKTERLGESLGGLFAAFGYQLPATRDGVRDLVEGLDLMTESGQAAFVAITGAADGLDEYYSAVEALAQDQADFTRDISTRLQQLSLSGQALDLFNLDQEFADLRAEAESLGLDLVQIEQLYGAERSAIVQRYADEALAEQERAAEAAAQALQRFAEQLQSVQQSLQRQITGLRGGSVAAFDIQSTLSAILSASDAQTILGLLPALQDALTAAYNEGLDEIERQRHAAIDAAQEQADIENNFRRARIAHLRDEAEALQEQIRAAEELSGIAADIRDYLSSAAQDSALLSPQEQLQAAQRELFRLTNAARGGDADAARSLTSQADAVLRIAQDSVGSAQELALIRATVLRGLQTTANQIDVSTAPDLALLDSINAEIESLSDTVEAATDAINAQFDASVAALRDALIAQLTGLAGVLPQISGLNDLEGAALLDALDAVRSGIVDAVNAGSDSTYAATTSVRDAVIAQASLFSGLDESITAAVLTQRNDVVAAIDASIASAAQQSDAIADALLGPVVGATNAMRTQLAASLFDQLLQQQLQADLTDLLGDDVRGLQAFIDAAALLTANAVHTNRTGVTGAIADWSAYVAGVDAATGSNIIDQIFNTGAQTNALLGNLPDITYVEAKDLQLNPWQYAIKLTIPALLQEIRDKLNGFSSSGSYPGFWWYATAENADKTWKNSRSIVEALNDANNGGSYSPKPVYAKGGVFTNSVVSAATLFDPSLMGEAGPEAIMPLSRGPDGSLGVRVFSRARPAADGTSRLEARLIAIEARLREVAQISRDGHYAVAKATGKTADQLRRWDGDGMPETRSVAA